MWTFETYRVSATVICAVVRERGATMPFADVVNMWNSNAKFRDWWSESLRVIAFEAFCWEIPPLTRTSMSKPFECAFVECPGLVYAEIDGRPFAEYFESKSQDSAVLFKNLGGDAWLVAPCPIDEKANYAHLAAFIRTASAIQLSEFWKVVGSAINQRIGNAPIWVSTAGLGVSWLHVRLDSYPKYYRHRSYASQQFWSDRK